MDNVQTILNRAKMKIEGIHAQPPKEQKKEKPSKLNEDLLIKALNDVSECTKSIPEEEIKIFNAVRKLEANKANDKHWEVKSNYLIDNLNIIKKTYPIYEAEAQRRRDLFNQITRRNKWQEEKLKCQDSTLYWFNNWSWTADPRRDGVGWALPFLPYDFQVDAIDWMESLIFTERSSGLIEKSRDMGLSWIIVSLLYKHWQHGDGSFQALIGSMTTDNTDVMGNPSSLFEKIRIQSRMQPIGLLPRNWNGEITYMKAINPETGASITGEACNERFGRSGRYKVIVFDELAGVEQDTEALTASSQSSPCKIYNSTVKGTGNEFARIRFSEAVPVKRYHWKEHPYKSEAWYEFQKVDINNPVIVAQELDIDYTASTPNKVYPMFSEVSHVITKSELIRALPSFGNVHGEFQVPLGHKIVMGQDVGQVHSNVMLWFLTFKEGTKTVDGVDLSGSILCYREVLIPQDTTVRHWANVIKEVEGKFEPRMMYDRVMSQEAITERLTYADEYQLQFRHWSPDYNVGIPRVRDYLEILHTDEPHPFREHTRKVKYRDKPPITGRPMLYFLSNDDQAELMYHEATQQYSAKMPKDSNGMRKTREEFPNYHYPSRELGKSIDKIRPVKTLDDAMDVIRCVATECFAPINRLTEQERYEQYLPEHLHSDNIIKMTPSEQAMAFIMLQEERRKFRSQNQNSGLSFREQIWNKAPKN